MWGKRMRSELTFQEAIFMAVQGGLASRISQCRSERCLPPLGREDSIGLVEDRFRDPSLWIDREPDADCRILLQIELVLPSGNQVVDRLAGDAHDQPASPKPDRDDLRAELVFA